MSATRQSLPLPDHFFAGDPGRTRILIECSDPALADASEYFLRRAGYDVAVCWGPAADAKGTSCPLIKTGHCPLAQAADVVVQSFPVSDRQRFPILRAVREHLPDKPVCVEMPAPSRAKYGPELDGCTMIDLPMTPHRLVRAVDAAAAGAR